MVAGRYCSYFTAMWQRQPVSPQPSGWGRYNPPRKDLFEQIASNDPNAKDTASKTAAALARQSWETRWYLGRKWIGGISTGNHVIGRSG
jgi:hypothetical protein